MTDLKRLLELIRTTTTQYRKGEEITEHEPKNGVAVTEVYMMPPRDQMTAEYVHFFWVGIHREQVWAHRDEFLAGIRAMEKDLPFKLAEGPSYQHLGNLMQQETALHLFAVGHYLGIWKLSTPESLGIEGEAADQLARGGLIYALEYKDAYENRDPGS